MSEKIKVACVDCARHDYIKVHLDVLNELGIIPLISGYSYVGIDPDDTTGLNEQKYAYLEGDTDWSIFERSIKFYGKELEWDDEALQEKYDETYDHYSEWLDALGTFDVEDISYNFDMEINDPSDELEAHLDPEEEEEEEVEDDSTDSTSSSE